MPTNLSTLESVRRQAEMQMRRSAPPLREQVDVKRRRVDDQGEGDDNNCDGDRAKHEPWLRFAYDGSSSLLGGSPTAAATSSSIVGFIVSSQIRKELSAAREAKKRLCSLLGVPEAEEEEQSVGVAGGGNVTDCDDNGGDGNKKALVRLSPTLSPVKIGCRGLGLLVYMGKKKKLEAGAASRAVEELVLGALEREKGEKRKGGKKKSDGDGVYGEDGAGSDDGAGGDDGGGALGHQPFAFVRRIVPVDAAVFEGGEGRDPGDGRQGSGGTGSSSGSKAIERLSLAVRSLVSSVDVRSLFRVSPDGRRGGGRGGGGGGGGEGKGRKEDEELALPSVVRFAVCYRRHVPSEQEQEAEGEKGTGGGKGIKADDEGGDETAAAAAARADAGAATTTATTTATSNAGLACRSAVIRAAAEALADSLPSALSPEQTKARGVPGGRPEASDGVASAAVDLKDPHVVLCVEVLPLARCLVATLALVPRRACDRQLRVRGVSSAE